MRGSQPFAGETGDVREMMLKYAPPLMDVPKDASYAVLQKAVTSVSMFGIHVGNIVNGDLERQGLPNLRFQQRGRGS